MVSKSEGFRLETQQDFCQFGQFNATLALQRKKSLTISSHDQQNRIQMTVTSFLQLFFAVLLK